MLKKIKSGLLNTGFIVLIMIIAIVYLIHERFNKKESEITTYEGESDLYM